MNSVLLFLGGFACGILFTLAAGYYLSEKLDEIGNRKV